MQVTMTKNNLLQVTNNGRTTEGEYRVALPDGRVQVEIFLEIFVEIFLEI